MRSMTVMAELAAHSPNLAGKKLVVVGLGRSGLAALRLARKHGARVTLNDRKSETELDREALDEARQLGAEIQLGGHPAALLDDAELVVVSPGVPQEIELLREARRRGLPVWGEIELAARFCRGRVIGITGSNGKSTVTSMAGEILRGAGVPGGTGGNLATPFADLLELDSPQAVHAVELSSFQLETVEALRPAVAVVLNLSPDHLDRYASLEEYAAAKARLLEVQAADGFAVLNADDEPSRVFRGHVRGRPIFFSTREELEQGGFLRAGRLVLRTSRGEDALCSADELPLAGEHNVANALAAALACRLVGCEPAAIVRGLMSFHGLPHRLQRVATLRGVTFYNDSKATNPAAAARALGAFGPGTVQLILGGRDKGADWAELQPLVRRHARRVLLVGEAAAELRRRFAEDAPVVDCGTVAEAVAAAFAGAETGDVVLLAPGCASFDQYSDFEERGEDFRRAVEALAAREGHDG